MMQSKLLNKHNVSHIITGIDNNLRLETREDYLAEEAADIISKWGVEPRVIYSGQQNHGKNVEYVDGENGEDFYYGKTFKGTDGLITDKKGLAMLVKFADCTPVTLYDPEKEVLAIVHSGWRGTVQEISLEALRQMVEDFGSQVEDVVAYVGPSIDQDNYEVGPEVYDAFKAFENRNSFFEPRREKYMLSNIDATIDSLMRAGIKKENIEIERESTWNSERLHSSRQEGKDYGVNSMWVMLPE